MIHKYKTAIFISLLMSFFLFTTTVFAAGEFVFSSWGGVPEKIQIKEMAKPFEQETGIKAIFTSYPDFAKVKAMVETKNVEWDVVDFEEKMLYRAVKEGLLEPMDYSLVYTKNIIPEAMNPYGIANSFWGGVLAYSKTTFPGDKGPRSWANFWDVEKFPGERALFKRPFGTLEIALLADGVPNNKLYPLDVDRAFKSLDKIKPYISVWWEKGAQPPQLLTDKEVDMCYAYSGRIVVIKKEGVPVDFVWNGALLNLEFWVIPKGAKNKKEAMQYIAFVNNSPQIQANFAMQLPYGPTNKKAWKLIDPKFLGDIAGNPELSDKMVIVNGKWWAENEEKVLERWNEWILD